MEIIAIGIPLVGLGVWLKYMPDRAVAWYRLAAWAESNGDAAVERKRRRAAYMGEAAKRAEVTHG